MTIRLHVYFFQQDNIFTILFPLEKKEMLSAMKHSEMHHQYGRPKKCSLLINNKNIYQEVILQNEKKSHFAKKKKN